MGARGPAPTPTKILQARGSWRAGLRDGEPQLPVEAPGCPSWLGREAKAEWRRVTAQLERMGILAKADRALLAAYCEAWGELVALVQRIAELTKDAGGMEKAIAAGLTSARNKAAERLLKLADRFGLSPAARTRVKAVVADDASDDGKGRFFRGGGRTG